MDPGLGRRLLAGELDQVSLEKRYRRPDGSEVWAKLSLTLVRDAQGQPAYFINVVEDIQARRARWDISSYVIHEPFLDALAPVVARLAGR